jgi:hypothetical protein
MNQIITLSPQQPTLPGTLSSDSVIVLCDTSTGAFSVTMPDGFATECKVVIIKNTGLNNLTINFPAQSLLKLHDEVLQVETLYPGQSMDFANDPMSGYWYTLSDVARFE